MKSYTDLEQSKKLETFLPIESADMHYSTWTILDGDFIVSMNQGSTIEDLREDYGNQIIPCWSLAALLNILPVGTETHKQIYDSIECYYVEVYNNRKYFCTDRYVNLLDACVEMASYLHEQKLL